jgi:carbon-monoxide dehydrogenase medium subunit/6-hydroxypseudooxynicotine dehydrogenase subunit alpha
MKPPPFEYLAAQTVDEALQALAADDDAKALAGGQSLIPLLNFRLARPALLVDLNDLGELAFVRREQGLLRIGAMTRHVGIERSTLVAERWPLLHQAILWVAHAQIRNRGTVGGSVAHADPAAELPVALTALEARFRARSVRGERWIAARDFFLNQLTSALEPDELLVEIEVPAVDPGAGSAFVEFARRHGDYGLGGTAVLLERDGDNTVTRAAIVLLGVAPVPVRATAAEEVLAGRRVDTAVAREAAAAAVADVRPTGDIHGSSEYRRALTETLVRRAVLQANAHADSRTPGATA